MTRRIDIPEPPSTLSLTLETACFIVAKAREYDVKVPPAEPDPASNAADSDASDILSDYQDDATTAELADAIDGLNEDQKAELVALVWIGRGDFEADAWQTALQAARDRHTGRTRDYLFGVPRLADLLEEGLSQFGLSCQQEGID